MWHRHSGDDGGYGFFGGLFAQLSLSLGIFGYGNGGY